MPSFTFEPSKEEKKRSYPVAIVKSTDKDKDPFHNKFLYLDPSEKSKKDITEVQIPEGCLFNLLPSTDPDKRDVFYIAGASGSGKSYIAKQLAEAYKRMYPDRQVYVVSKLTEDSTLDSMKGVEPIRLDYTQFVEAPPDINALSNSMIIFDDYDTIEGKAGDAVQTLINDIAIMGRKHTEGQGNVTMLCLTHHITNYKKTRLLLNEATHFVVYPQATSTHALTYLLKTHLGLERDEVKALKRMGRWVCFSKMYPQYLIAAQKAVILHQD